GVLVRRGGVLVDQHPGSREVSGDPGRQLLREALELGGHRAVELLARDLLGDRGPVVTGLLLGPVELLTRRAPPVVLAGRSASGRGAPAVRPSTRATVAPGGLAVAARRLASAVRAPRAGTSLVVGTTVAGATGTAVVCHGTGPLGDNG